MQTHPEEATADLKTNAYSVWVRAVTATLLVLTILIAVTILIGTVFLHRYLSVFSQVIDVPYPEVASSIVRGVTTQSENSTDYTFLILGTDTVQNRIDQPVLTDTIMYINLNLDTGIISLYSLPRDLWSEAYQTKINALYYYSQERDPQNPLAFVSESVSELTSVTPNLIIPLTLQQVGSIIDLIGGISVDVPHGFTDTQFPRDDVDLASASPEVLYKTVSFASGPQTMNSDQALAFIRSRMSQDDAGNDLDRAVRQQLIIQALVEKITSSEILLQPRLMGELFIQYQQIVGPSLTLQETVELLVRLYKSSDNITLNKSSPSIFPDSENGILEHPPQTDSDDPWIYTIRDLQQFQSHIKTELGVMP